jgi:hypothetical protein
MKIVLHQKKIACGTSEGPVVLFNWDWYGDFKDRIMGHPGSVNCLEKFDENVIITGCEDGGLRFVTINPKSINSMISDKKKLNLENPTFKDINAISLNSNKTNLAVCTNINYIKIYDISGIEVEGVDKEFEEQSQSVNEENENEEISESKTSEYEVSANSESKNEEEEENSLNNIDTEDNNNSDLNDADDVEEESDADMDSFSDSSDKKKKKDKNKNTLKLKALGKKRTSDWMIEKERRKDFFNDI